MSEWREVSLREISTHIKDGTHGTHRRVEVGIPLLSAKNIGNDGRLRWDRSDDLVSETDYSAITATSAPKYGDVLLTVVGSIGRAALFDGSRVAFQRSVAFVRGTNDVLPAFLYQAISSINFTRQLERRCNVTAQAGLYLGELAKCRISLPSSERQQKIAAILTGIDTAIEKTEALIAKYQQIKAGLMHDLFTRGVLPNGQLRPPREQAPELYQETAIGWIPREWEVAGLAAKGRPGTHWIRTGPFGSALKGEHWRTHGHPVITIGALGEGVFTDDELLFVDSRDAARLVDFQLKAGDIVFSRVADVGRSVVVRAEQTGWIMSSNLMRIAVDENRARPDLVQMALASDSRIKAQIRARVNCGGRDVANSDVLNQLRFVWPDIEEQDRIIARADLAGRRITSEQLKRSNLLAQKQGLMHDLLTGKVPVKVEEPEVVDG